jgi:hypothetical protein
VEDTAYERPRGNEPDRIRFACGGNFEGLVTVKANYDADNFFKSNQKELWRSW